MKDDYATNSHYLVPFSFLFRKEWENLLFELGSERVKMHPRKVKPTTPSVHLLRRSKRKLSIVNIYSHHCQLMGPPPTLSVAQRTSPTRVPHVSRATNTAVSLGRSSGHTLLVFRARILQAGVLLCGSKNKAKTGELRLAGFGLL